MRKKKEIDVEYRKDKPLVEPYKHGDHDIPTSRREFLAQGLMGIAGAAFFPSITDLILSNKAYAEELNCPKPIFKQGIPYLCVDLAGGANLVGNNFLMSMARTGPVHNAADISAKAASDFRRFGLIDEYAPFGNNEAPSINTDFGIPMHSQSPMLMGMMAALKDLDGNYFRYDYTDASGTRQIPINRSVDGAICAVASADDTSSNPFNTVHAAAKAGAIGKLINVIGSRGSDSGGNSVPSAYGYSAKDRSVAIRNGNSARNLVNEGESLSNYLSANGASEDESREKLRYVTRKIASMKKSRLEEIKKLDFKRQAQQLLGCSFQNVSEVFKEFSPDVLDPEQDQHMSAAFNDVNGSASAITKLVLDGYSGAGTICLGGYDYHGGTAIRGQTMDFHAGIAIGKALKAAALKKKDLVIHLYTDGSVGGALGGTPEEVSLTTMADGKVDDDNLLQVIRDSQLGGNDTMIKNVWQSDQGSNGATVMLVFKYGHDRGALNNDRLLVDGNKNQFGRFTDKGVDRQSSVPANDVNAAARWVIANYMALNGKGKAQAEELFGRNFFSGVEEGIFFRPIVDEVA